MSTETPPSADGTCLGCAQVVTLRPDGKLVEHDSDDNFQLCHEAGQARAPNRGC